VCFKPRKRVPGPNLRPVTKALVWRTQREAPEDSLDDGDDILITLDAPGVPEPIPAAGQERPVPLRRSARLNNGEQSNPYREYRLSIIV